ncbi:hypothetical protein F441_19907 [Phytophthora nicotianae CJ01A1]|uniref:RxLR effector protein n=7 Tax=Phytophthora nicotianae TaxID=4792 RepID=W2PIB9_PHYN3|nr:hypothetical protein PPTG_17825 [Phytophthora nicotianae INRA-310]ETL80275.1 hypothetical protein L917_19220 [Phytophthora nicotianae]ETO61991.1 hypothetical protein F444_20049 [Phytophthora nicotianae P1976]ETP03097.1 hypothetical protein F441_19915 [Phytophthora nicotianae CJ01A1]ETP31246.1 hypothetical protein F442_19854 [Phytophthora nicotianae P10297]KUF77951.1 hypothetical protein AM588_10000043 [Phytophthora nicotianae]
MGAATTRLLRTTAINYDDDEERLAGFDTITKLVKSGKEKYKESKQLKSWLKDKQSADEVFGLLKLDDGVGNVLTKEKVKVWASYVSKFNKKYQNDRVYMIDMLVARYGDDGVSMMIEAAKRDPVAKKLADKLQTDQFRGWIRSEKSADDVFKILKLDDPANIANSNMNAWLKYLDVFNHRFRDKATNMLDTFTRVYGGEKELAKMLVAAQKVPATKLQAEELQAALFTKWFKNGWQTKDVMTQVLKLDKTNWAISPDAVILTHYNKFYKNQVIRNDIQ